MNHSGLSSRVRANTKVEFKGIPRIRGYSGIFILVRSVVSGQILIYRIHNKSNIRGHSIYTYLFGARELVFSIYPRFALI